MQDHEKEFLNNQELFKSNLLKFQMNELLAQNQSKAQKLKKFIQPFLDLKLTPVGSYTNTLILQKVTLIDMTTDLSTIELLSLLKDYTFKVDLFLTKPVLIAQKGSFAVRVIPSSLPIEIHQKYQQDLFSKITNLKEALILIKIWARKRGFYELGLNGFLFMLLTGVMTKIGSLKKYFSSWQIFKVSIINQVFLDFLSKLNLELNYSVYEPELYDSLLEKKETKRQKTGNSKSKFEQTDKFALIDPTGTVNVMSHVTTSTLALLKYESQQTLNLINSTDDIFEEIFLKVQKVYLKFDNVFKIPLDEKRSDLNLSNLNDKIEGIYSILKRALGDRVIVIKVSISPLKFYELKPLKSGFKLSVDSNSLANWEKTSVLGKEIQFNGDLEDIQFHLDEYDIVIGMILDPHLSLKQVETCQSEDPATINDFKQLWGQKSELRRFKDGSIYESVVFDNNQSLHQKSLTVARMTAFLLKRHFQLDEDDGVTYWAGLGNKYLKEVDNEELGFEIVNEQYGKLCRELRSLELPLAINRFHIIDDKLVQSSIIIPEPVIETDLKSRSQPIEFLLEFEFSAKWPDDLKAIETMKRAFLIKICSESEDKEYSCKVGVDDKNQSFLDINFNGYLFRLRILHQRIQYLLERSLLEADSKTKDDLLKYDKEYKTIYSRTPLHYQLLQPLIYRYTFLADSIRLLKRWFSCQLALGYIDNTSNSAVFPQVIELLCVYVYSRPGVYSVPASAFTGFCRALELLSIHEWDREPLMIELEPGKLTKDISNQIQDNFDSLKKVGNPFGAFIATELDVKSEWWNTLKINPKVWQRIIMLSSESCNYIKTQLSTAKNNDIEKLFVANIQGFDFMIQLDPTLIIDHKKQIHPKIEFKSKNKFKNVVSKADLKTIQYSKFDFQKEYLKCLREVYSDKILFFGDRMGGDQIFGKILWKGEKFGAGMGNLKIVGNQIEYNKEAVLAEIERLGQGLVVGIEDMKES